MIDPLKAAARIAAILSVTVALSASVAEAQGQSSSGQLDHQFGDAGKVSVHFKGLFQPSGGWTTPSGLIIVVGNTAGAAGEGGDLMTVRLRPDGRLDQRIGRSGRHRVTVEAGPLIVRGLALGPGGKAIVAGALGRPGVDQDLALLRVGSDGRLDPTFGVGGIQTTDFGGPTETAESVAIAQDGSIVVVGTAQGPAYGASRHLVAASYRSDGTLDPSFGDLGKVTIGDLGTSLSYVTGDSVEALADGKVILAGNAGQTGGGPEQNSAFVVRLLANGAPDPSIGNVGDGRSWLPGPIVLRSLTLARTGRPVVAGFSMPEGTGRFITASLQESLSIGRIARTSFGGPEPLDAAADVVVDPKGRIVVGGTASPKDSRSGRRAGQFAVARYRADLRLDNRFGHRGRSTVRFGKGWSSIVDLVIQRDGKIVAIGTDVQYSPERSIGGLRIARFLNGP